MDRAEIIELARLCDSDVDKKNADNVHIRCPYAAHPGYHPGGSRTPSLSVKVMRGRQSPCHCWGCGVGGSLLSVFSDAQEEVGGFEEPLAFIKRHDRGDFASMLAALRAPPPTDARPRTPDLERYVARCCRQVPAFLVEQGYVRHDVDRWRLGYDPDGPLRMRATFPTWDQHGTLVGVSGRTVLPREQERIKWMDQPSSFAQVKRHHFYGEHRVDATLEHGVLVEGPSSAVFAARVMPNVLGLYGAKTGISRQRLDKLRRWFKTITLLLDADEAGREAVEGWQDPRTEKEHPGLRELLRPYFVVRVATLPEGHDPKSVPGDVVLAAVRNAQYLPFAKRR